MPARLLALAAVAALFAGPAAAQQQYTFTRVADSAGPFASFGPPAINAAGAVAFVATLDAGGSGVYLGPGGATTIATSAGSGLRNFAAPAVDGAGRVAFFAERTAGGFGVYTGAGAGTTTVADSAGSLDVLSHPAVNAAGTVAFQATRDLSQGSGVFTGTGAGLTTVADSAGPTFDSFFGSPAVAGSRVAFGATRDAGGFGLFVASGPNTVTIAANGPVFTNFTGVLAMNDSGVVAFQASRAGGSGVYTGDGTGLTAVAETGAGRPFAGFGDPAINAAGGVAFKADLTPAVGGGAGVFTGPSLTGDVVVRVGDLLDGATVSAVEFGRFGLNDAGQVAFQATLTDGRRGVFVATPVPEPAGVLAAGGLAAAAWRARRRPRAHAPR